MDFPVYRKYKNGKNYFMLTSMATMQEVRLIGKYFQIQDFEATIHPDRVLINDLLKDFEAFADEITLKEYDDIIEHCHQNLTKIELQAKYDS